MDGGGKRGKQHKTFGVEEMKKSEANVKRPLE